MTSPGRIAAPRFTLKVRVFSLVCVLVISFVVTLALLSVEDLSELLHEDFRARGEVVANYFARTSVEGIIIEDELYCGPSGSAGEIGHMVIDVNGRPCNCGGVGCLETLTSGAALASDVRDRLEAGEPSALAGLAGGGPAGITAEMVGRAAMQGDVLAREAVRRAGRYLGVGMANLVNILNPEVIVVGGGLSRMGDLLLDPARETVHEMAFRLPARAVRIVTAQLGEDAGVIGAGVIGRGRRAVP